MEWFVYGGLVLDRLLGVSRSERISVYFDGTPPPSDFVCSALDIKSRIPIDYTEIPPRVTCDLDKIVILPNRDFFDIEQRTTCHPTLPLVAKLATYDLTATDVLRLWRLRETYPEIAFDDLLAARLAADLAHLSSLRREFDTLEMEFVANDLT